MAVDAPHIPAWRRIGLKLAHEVNQGPEKDSYSDQTPSFNAIKKNTAASDVPTRSPGVTGKRVRDHEHDSPSAKKAKRAEIKSDPADEDEHHMSGALPALERPEISESSTPIKSASSRDETATNGKTPKRRKSVTFAADTKREDGNELQAHHDDFVAQVKADPGDEDQISPEELAKFTSAPSTHSLNDPDASQVPSTKKPKKAKNQDLNASSSTEQVNGHSKSSTALSTHSKAEPQYLQYLNAFHSSKETWKFNKSKQTDLLKNIWNFYRIPASYNSALESYIRGLQSAGPRKLLREQTEQNIKDLKDELKQRQLDENEEVDEEHPSSSRQASTPIAMTSIEERRAAYAQAAARDLAIQERNGLLTDEVGAKIEAEWALKRQRDERSTMLLHAFLASEVGYQLGGDGLIKQGKDGRHLKLGEEDGQAEAAAVVPSARQKKKMKKSRTEVVSSSESESESSSSESDSSSEEESDSDSSSAATSSEDDDDDDDDDDSDSDSSSSDSASDTEGEDQAEAGPGEKDKDRIFDKAFLDKCFGATKKR